MVYTPQQNGIAERFNRTLLDLVRSSLRETKLPRSAWAELTYTAAYVRNRLMKTHDPNKTPNEIWTGRKPSVRRLRETGSEVFVQVSKPKRHSKLTPRAEKGILIGYTLRCRGYIVWMPESQQIKKNQEIVSLRQDTMVKVLVTEFVKGYRRISSGEM